MYKRQLWTSRVDYRIVQSPLLLGVEYRMLQQREADDNRSGWLNELSLDANAHVRFGVGYNFSRFSGDPLVRTPADNQTVRNVFVIGPDKKVKLIMVYPMTTGRNFDEVLRVIDSMQLTAKHRVATPVNWKNGEDVIIAGSVSDEEAKTIYPQGWKAPRPYIRIVPQPKGS